MSAVSAGEVLRTALAGGEGKRTLARRLAGEGADLAEIERWRAVVVRADRGGEPNELQAKRVAEVFDVEVQLPPLPAPTRRDQLHRLEEVEDALEVLGPELDRLADRVLALEQLLPSRTHGGESGGQS